MAYRPQTTQEVDRLQPPQSIDAEQGVLGAVLKDPDAMYRAIEILDTPDHFYHPRHRQIFTAILALINQNQPCDITTVANWLLKEGLLEQAGGRTYLVELVEAVPSSAHVASYANLVLEKSVLRRLIETSTEIVRSCYDQDQQADELLDSAEKNIFDISGSRVRQGFYPIKGLVDTVTANIESFHASGGSFDGVHTGFEDLDKLTEGFHNNDFIVIAGRPSMGKTAFALNIAEQVAIDQRKGVAMFSIEMSREQLVMRLMCGRAGFTQQQVRSSYFNDKQMRHLIQKSDSLRDAPIYIDDSPALSILEMRAKSRRLKAQYKNLSLIVVDYLQLMHLHGKTENRQQEIAIISRGLKALAKDLEVPVIACSQLSRMVEQRGGDKIPQLSDLRESGAIEQDADVVIFVHRPDYYWKKKDYDDDELKPVHLRQAGLAEIIVAKQRNGPTGTANLTFIKHLARFENRTTRNLELPPDAQPVDMPF